MAVEANVQLLAALRCPLCREPLDGGAPTRCGDCATAYHAACVAELGVPCATLGCSSRPAPARGPKPAAAAAPLREVLGPLAAAWLVFLAWPLALPIAGLALARAWSHPRRRRLLPAVCLGSPFVAVPLLSAAAAVVGYATGTAEVVLARGERYVGLDPVTRCGQRSGPYFGNEPISATTHDLVLRGLIRLLGPMPGAYDGPLPTGPEALALLAGPSARIGCVEQLDDRGAASRVELLAVGRTLVLDAPAALGVGGVTRGSPLRPVWYVPLDETGLLVAAPGEPADALVFDLRAGRAVALVVLRPRPSLSAADR